MSNELTVVNFDQLPSVQLGTDADFGAITTAGAFLGRLQLFTKGKLINRKIIQPGCWGIPEGDDQVTDLGENINLLVFARRPKALDMSDTDALVVSYDVNSDEFKRIQSASAEQDSHCMYGPSFLVFEQTTGRFLEYFCGSKSSRSEAKKLFPYLPLTAGMIEQMAKAGQDVTNLTPHGPIPVTLGVKLVETKSFSWHVPVVKKGTAAFTNLPKQEATLAEIQKFLTAKSDQSEKAAGPKGKERAR